MSPQKRRALFERLRSANPHPTTELAYTTPFELLVSVVLSAQATDKSVNAATEKLYRDANTPQSILDLGEQGLIAYIKTIGLYRSKAKHIIETCRLLIERHGGEVPLERAALEALPGVGRKTASVVLNELGAEAAIAVDTHVFRVAHRLRLSKGKTPHEVERDLMRVVPPARRTRAHHWLILHGRYVCVARKPKCATCVVGDLCPSRELYV